VVVLFSSDCVSVAANRSIEQLGH